jgi:transposase
LESQRFHLIKLLPKGFKFDASYDVTQILDPLSVWSGTHIGRTSRKLIVHAENARFHTVNATLDFLERNAMKRVPHLPYSPDLAPSDFYLFGHVKQLLRRYEFADREALLHVIENILKGIKTMILEDVFLSWVERLRQCGSAAGEYVE